MLDALLVFDEAEGLFGARHAGDAGSAARYANLDVGLLLHHLERFPRALVLITNTIDNIDKVRMEKNFLLLAHFRNYVKVSERRSFEARAHHQHHRQY